MSLSDVTIVCDLIAPQLREEFELTTHRQLFVIFWLLLQYIKMSYDIITTVKPG
jgi:hypothetical protein